MAKGYMGFDEPEVAPRGNPEHTPPTEQTLTNAANPQPEITAPPAPENKPDTPPAKVEKVVSEVPEDKKPEPQVVEKIVEKIIEKYPEFKDENSKTLYEAWTNGEMDKVKAYWREMDKNYDTMSDIDVVREGLSKKNPQWTKDDVELELRAEYGKQLEKYNLDDFDKDVDPEGYREAKQHNDRADENLLRLQRAARDNRVSLKEQQKAVELPKINKEEATPPVSTAPTKEQIDESKRLWAEQAEKEVPALADYKFQVGDDKNPEEVVFAVTPEDKSARIEAMKTWNGQDFMVKRGWKNEDGSFNLLKIAEDVHTLENTPKMVKSAYTQGVTSGRKSEVANIKNIDNQRNRQDSVPSEPVSAGALYWT